MSKEGVLAQLAKQLAEEPSFRKFFTGIMETGKNKYNEAVNALRASSPKHEAELAQIDDWNKLLDTPLKTPRSSRLSEYPDQQLLEYIAQYSPNTLRRVQPAQNLELGNSVNPKWLGTHFDASGSGAQLLDIVGAQKRLHPTKLKEQYMVRGELDPASRGILISDYIANTPRATYWSKLLDESPERTSDPRKLVEMLRANNIDWLLYPNKHEGLKLQDMLTPPPGLRSPSADDAKETLYGTLEQLRQHTQNPAISVLQPKAFSLQGVNKKNGGLVNE